MEGPKLRESLRVMPREAWILSLGAFINRFGSFVLPFLVLYLSRAGFSKAQAGIALSFYGAGSLAAVGAGGLVADRIGRKASIAISMFASATVMMLLSQARAYWLILLLVTIAGLTAEMYRPATGALMTDVVPPERRVAAFALYRLGINLGFAAGLASAGFLAERSFFLLFVVEAATSVAFGILALVALPEGARSARVQEQRGEALRAIARDRAFMLFLLASVCGSVVYAQAYATLPLRVEDLGHSPKIYGLLQALNGGVVVLLELPITSLTQRLRPVPVMVFAYVLLGLGFSLTGVFATAPLLGLAVVIWTLGEITGAPVSSAYVAGLSPPHLRGRYQGAWSFTFGMGFVIAPLVGTAVYARKPVALWALCGLLGVVAGVLIAPSKHRRSEVIK